MSGPADAAPPAAAGDAGGPRSGRRPQGPLAAGGVAAAAALPEPYDTAPPLSAYQPGPGGNGYDPVGDQLAGSEPVTRGAGREDRSRRRRRSDRNERTDTSIAAVTGLLPPPPQGRDAGPAGERAGRRPAVRAVPDPELADPAGQWSAEHRSAERRPTAKEARRASRAAAIDFPDPDADRDVPPDSPALAIQRAEPAAARPLRAVEVEPGVNIDPDIDPDSSIHYGFEEDEEPSLLVQWGVFFLQTIVGAAGGLGVWLGFHVLWDRWPFYAAAAVGVALAGMLVIARALRRRYGHELDLLTVLVAVGVGVVLTVLPAAFALHSL